jgi:hypothetical protein
VVVVAAAPEGLQQQDLMARQHHLAQAVVEVVAEKTAYQTILEEVLVVHPAMF